MSVDRHLVLCHKPLQLPPASKTQQGGIIHRHPVLSCEGWKRHSPPTPTIENRVLSHPPPGGAIEGQPSNAPSAVVLFATEPTAPGCKSSRPYLG